MREKPQLCRAIVHALALLTILARCGLALDPTQPAGSYIRTAFTVEDGLPSNVVNAIVQTRNGFLWIGTDAGLARFDGRHFTMIDFRGPRSAAQGVVRSLAEGPDGDLWVGTHFGLARIPTTAPDESDRWPSTFYHHGAGQSDEITSLKFTHDGALWVGTSDGLFRFDRGHFAAVLSGMGMGVGQIEEASDGHLLVVAGLKFFEWDGARIVEHAELAVRLGIGDHGFFRVIRDHTGATWFCTGAGVARLSGNSIHRYSPYGAPYAQGALTLIEDRQGNVWVFTKRGLFRCTPTSLEPLAPGASVRSLFSDRDGNLWVGTNGDGLVRFKDRPVRMFTTAEGLPNNIPMTVVARHDGSIWVGNNCGGLSWFDARRFHTYDEKNGLLNSCVWALAEDSNNDLWIGTWGGGLFRFKEGHFTQYSIPQGLSGDVVRSVIAARDGSLWIATMDGLSHMVNGRFRNYTTVDGLSSNRVVAVYQDRHGVIWAGTSRGIARMTGDRFAPLSSPREIFDPRYISLEEGPSGDLYAFSAPKGLSRVEGNQLVGVNTDLDVLSLADFEHRDLWFSGGNGIFRLAVSSVSPTTQDSGAPLDYLSVGRADGLNSTQCSLGAPNMAITRDGQLWVATVQGLALLDLRRLPRTNRKPAIFMEEVTVGQKKQPIRQELVLPPGTHHLELKFDSIELASPEKIRFQYRLDGVDPDWLNADATRTAVYTSIPLGAHSFHVRACDRDGVWDRAGIVYNVSQRPHYYETNWFRLLAFLVVASLITAIYFLRLRRIAGQIQSRFEERLAERTRIARELHDTLLQSFHGLIFRFQAADNLLPARPTEAKQTLDSALDDAAQAITEARDAVHELRSSAAITSDLAAAVTALGEELAAHHTSAAANENSTTFLVEVEGRPQDLHPILRDEIYRIAGEGLRNAFRHARARRIEVEIRYDERQLRVRIRDDGSGIDPSVLSHEGRAGHWGLTGMRERAKRIGGEMDVWSELGAGTEVELRIPSSFAYQTYGGRSFRLFRKKTGTSS
jgi:signal transduction histidine kinase/ligand-binding sensor domain-containing protein